jgi:hypothetical protein
VERRAAGGADAGVAEEAAHGMLLVERFDRPSRSSPATY